MPSLIALELDGNLVYVTELPLVREFRVIFFPLDLNSYVGSRLSETVIVSL